MKTRPFAAPILAAALLLSPAPAFAHHDGTHHDEAQSAPSSGQGGSAVLGDLTVAEPWSRATPPTTNVAAAYFSLSNAGAATARLIGGSSPRAARVEIHQTTMEADVAHMRAVPEGVEIAPGGAVEFRPGGHHLMLIGLDAPLAEGESVPLTLEFDTGSLSLELPVRAMGATSGASGHGGH